MSRSTPAALEATEPMEIAATNAAAPEESTTADLESTAATATSQAPNDETPPPATTSDSAAAGVASMDIDDDEKSSMAGSSSSSTLGIDDSSDLEEPLDEAQDPNELIMQAVTLKEEGNAAFKEGNLTLASRSYRKGTNVLKKLDKANTGDDQVKSLLVNLQTNLSMVSFKQNKPQQSRDVATKALEIDATHVKALFRRAVAYRKLGCPDEAKRDLKQALKHDANNVTVKRELHSIKKEMEAAQKRERELLKKAFSKKSSSLLYGDKEEEERKKLERERQEKLEKEEAFKKRKQQWEDECVKRMAKDEEPIPYEEWDKQQKEKEEQQKKFDEELKRMEREERRKKQKSKPVVHDSSSDEELTESELKMFRGYKKTSDGRTTSYFTREVSEHEKQLIGDIAPKRLGETGAASEPSLTESSRSAASAWNIAGTWEEKDTTDWCTSHLKSCLQQCTCTSENVVAVITSVTNLVGHASVAMTGGKKRYIFDFHTTLDYEIRLLEDDSVVAKAQVKLPDVSSTTAHDDSELEVEVFAWKESPSAEMDKAASACRDELVKAVRVSVKGFVQDFNDQY